MPQRRSLSGTYLEKRVQLDEFGMYSRYVVSRFGLTEIQIRAIENRLAGVSDRELADQFGVTRQAINDARKTGLRRMRKGLAELGIHGVSAVI
jgi:predicted DNA-binding protein YlxM (UPF0122 family)